ncbi:hypothetical protein F4677DRAFT_444500 [Hypoxylon crocopeplum]|nr:hypothetical protein F4677DRAFT_444500 [Hypoxylon crocopeplum]
MPVLPTLQDDFDISIADPVRDWKPEGQISMINFTTMRLLEIGCCQSEVHHFLQSFDAAAAAYYVAHTHPSIMASVLIQPAWHTRSTNSPVGPSTWKTTATLAVSDGRGVYYIAFSHVWVDGLGNPSLNALPSCQIRRLYNLAVTLRGAFNLNESNPKVAIWIDILYIPVTPELKEYRKRTIRLLAQIYIEAMVVLVLGGELCRFESRKAPALELGIRVLCSGWLKRLWTLQEASLASDIQGASVLYFQMADGPAYWNRLSRCFQYKPSYFEVSLPPKPSTTAVSIRDTKADLLYEMHLMTAMEDRIPSVRVISNPRFDTKFQKVMHAVQNRYTSKAEDEPVCLASLVGLDPQSILNAKDIDNRMAEFYKLLRELPTVILFSEFGVPNFLATNLTIPPYRWAPRSLLLLELPMEITNAISAMRFMDPPSLRSSRRSCWSTVTRLPILLTVQLRIQIKYHFADTNIDLTAFLDGASLIPL